MGMAKKSPPGRFDQQRSRRRNTIMFVTQFHRAADSIGTLFMLLMGLATGGALAIVGI
jgi:hypothetical protein